MIAEGSIVGFMLGEYVLVGIVGSLVGSSDVIILAGLNEGMVVGLMEVVYWKLEAIPLKIVVVVYCVTLSSYDDDDDDDDDVEVATALIEISVVPLLT